MLLGYHCIITYGTSFICLPFNSSSPGAGELGLSRVVFVSYGTESSVLASTGIEILGNRFYIASVYLDMG